MRANLCLRRRDRRSVRNLERNSAPQPGRPPVRVETRGSEPQPLSDFTRLDLGSARDNPSVTVPVAAVRDEALLVKEYQRAAGPDRNNLQTRTVGEPAGQRGAGAQIKPRRARINFESVRRRVGGLHERTDNSIGIGLAPDLFGNLGLIAVDNHGAGSIPCGGVLYIRSSTSEAAI